MTHIRKEVIAPLYPVIRKTPLSLMVTGQPLGRKRRHHRSRKF